jgi:hypothetical protein
MKRLYLTYVIDLPDSPFEAAEVYTAIKAPWGALGEALATIGVPCFAKIEEMETRAKVKRAPRKPKAEKPELGLVKPDEAA